MLVYSVAYKEGGHTANVIYFATGWFVGLVLLGMTTALTRFSCADFATAVVLPLLMKQPLALVGSPVVYALKNTFGQGPGVDGILLEYARIHAIGSVAELRQELFERGRGSDLPWLTEAEEPQGDDPSAAEGEANEHWSKRSLVELQTLLKGTAYISSAMPALRIRVLMHAPARLRVAYS